MGIEGYNSTIFQSLEKAIVCSEPNTSIPDIRSNIADKTKEIISNIQIKEFQFTNKDENISNFASRIKKEINKEDKNKIFRFDIAGFKSPYFNKDISIFFIQNLSKNFFDILNGIPFSEEADLGEKLIDYVNRMISVCKEMDRFFSVNKIIKDKKFNGISLPPITKNTDVEDFLKEFELIRKREFYEYSLTREGKIIDIIYADNNSIFEAINNNEINYKKILTHISKLIKVLKYTFKDTEIGFKNDYKDLLSNISIEKKDNEDYNYNDPEIYAKQIIGESIKLLTGDFSESAEILIKEIEKYEQKNSK